MPTATIYRMGFAWAFLGSSLALAGMLAPMKASAQFQPGEPGTFPEAPYTPQETTALPPTGDKADVKGETAAHGREATVQLARCILKRHRTAAQKVIELSADSSVFVPQLARLARSRCLASGELRIPPLLLRGALFEELYKQEFWEARLQDLSKAPPVNYLQGYQQPLSEASKQALAMSFVGDCLVRADTSSARLMVASIPGTEREDQATGALAARLPQCIPQGQTLKFSRSFIRAAVSEALYRLSREQLKTATRSGGTS
jgi:hypothetical protein